MRFDVMEMNFNMIRQIQQYGEVDMQQKELGCKLCRKCYINLVVGDNWTLGKVRQNSYICQTCSRVDKAVYRKESKERKQKGLKFYKEMF
jgi:RNase P subunit RPR2